MAYLKETPLIFFDGNCGVCNFFVQFIIEQDKKKLFYFISLNSPLAKKILENNSLSHYQKVDSILLLDENMKIWKYSTAVLKILQRLKYFSILYFFILIPSFIRDSIYKIFAKNRFSFMSKKCIFVNKNLSERFLDL